MKTIGVWNLYPQLSTNNYLFLHPNAPIGDNLLLPFNELYLTGRTRGVRFVTLDLVEDFSTLDGIIFIDFPGMMDDVFLRAMAAAVPLYLITFEPPCVRPENWDLKTHEHFRRVFTWDDRLIDCDAWNESKYVKINSAQRFPKIIPHDGPTRDRLACMIASNKSSEHPHELYSARRGMIRWFEKHHSNEFDLFGPGWRSYASSWRGTVPPGQKRWALARYKFSICYENAVEPGYLTEKIFDCFVAGTIPVYLGDSNIHRSVPSDCFIDARELTREEIYRVISTMTIEEHNRRIEAIQHFTTRAYRFTTDAFVETILGAIG